MDQDFDSRGQPHPLPFGSRGKKALVPILIAMALLLRLAVFAINVGRTEPRFLLPDSYSYLSAADSLARRGTILDPSGHPTWGRVPVYPVLLAVFFRAGWASPERLNGAILFQIALGTLAVFLAARIALWLDDTKAAAVVAGILALDPSCIAYSNVLLTEIPYMVGLLLVVEAWRRWRCRGTTLSLLTLSLSVGFLPLLRPVALYLPLAMAPLMLVRPDRISRRIGTVLAFMVVAFLPSSLWTLRNFVVLGSARIHYTGPWAQAMFAREVETGLGIQAEPVPGSETQPWDLKFGRDQNLPDAQIDRLRSDYFERTVRAHPLASLRVFLANGVGMMGVPDSLLSELLLETPLTIEGGSLGARIRWLAGQGILLGVLLVLGMAVSLGGTAALPWLVGRPPFRDSIRKSVLGFLEVLVVYHIALSSLVGHQGERYRVPIVPVLAILLVLALRSVRMPKRLVGNPVPRPAASPVS